MRRRERSIQGEDGLVMENAVWRWRQRWREGCIDKWRNAKVASSMRNLDVEMYSLRTLTQTALLTPQFWNSGLHNWEWIYIVLSQVCAVLLWQPQETNTDFGTRSGGLASLKSIRHVVAWSLEQVLKLRSWVWNLQGRWAGWKCTRISMLHLVSEICRAGGQAGNGAGWKCGSLKAEIQDTSGLCCEGHQLIGWCHSHNKGNILYLKSMIININHMYKTLLQQHLENIWANNWTP